MWACGIRVSHTFLSDAGGRVPWGLDVFHLGAGRGPPTGTSECKLGLGSEAWEAFPFLA